MPRQPLLPAEVSQAASHGRLAQAELDAATRARGLNRVTSVTDIELGVIRNTTKTAASSALS